MEEAKSQLESAIILHVDTAWQSFKWSIKKFIQLKCPVCGNRHYIKSYHYKRPGYSMDCSYGWWKQLKSFRKHISLCLQHGED